MALVAKIADLRKVGARALRSIIEEVMLNYMFEAPTTQNKEITITESDIRIYIKEKLPISLQKKLESKQIKQPKRTPKKAA